MKLTNSKKEKADTQLGGCQFFFLDKNPRYQLGKIQGIYSKKESLTQKRVQVSVFYIFRVQKLCSLRLVLELESLLQDIF